MKNISHVTGNHTEKVYRICSVQVVIGSTDTSPSWATGFAVTDMKNCAMNLLVLLITISILSNASEISVTSIYNIIKCVISKYHSTCVNFLYSEKNQGASVNLNSVDAIEQCLHTYPQRIPPLDPRLFNNAVSTSEI
jgi:cadmium resistance protein CadD (predicted permease)